MPMATKGGIIMSSKHLFSLLLMIIVSAGCGILDRSSPNVAALPPYWQPQGQAAPSQFDEMRAFHDKESAKMSEDMHVFRNREMERFATAGKELETDKRQQGSNETTVERQGTWTSWFKKKNKEGAPLVGETNKTLL